MTDSAYVFQKLENDTENQASMFRAAEAQSLNPSKIFSSEYFFPFYTLKSLQKSQFTYLNFNTKSL